MMYLAEIKEGIQHSAAVANLEFEKTYDVIVCGLGTAGAFAALFSAENGMSVLGIEAFTCAGGIHTAGGVEGHYFGHPGGLYEMLDKRVADFTQKRSCTMDEGRKLITEAALTEQGVEIVYESVVVGVYLDENRVIGVKAALPDGLHNFGVKVLMDCTAEASVAYMAGCATEYGRALDGQTQPYSMVSMVYNGTRYHPTNVDFGRVNQLDDWALSEAIIFSRAYEMPEDRQDKKFVAHKALIGLREGRRIIAEEGYSVRQLFAETQTESPMYYSYADLDKHGWDIAFDGETLGDWAIGANLGAYNVTVAVPYKTILPKDFEGILVPCRALGVDRDIASCVRMIPDMKKIAETAAQWATLAIKGNCSLREVPYSQLRDLLLQSGCLNPDHNWGYRVDGVRNWDGSPLIKEEVRFITDPQLLEARLKTDKPGQAIWAAKRIGNNAIPALQVLLRSTDENTQKHAAFALAILENRDCLPVLRTMAETRDGFMLKDCRKHNQLRGCMAIYWLGRLADKACTDTLIQLLCDKEEFCKPVYQTRLQTTRYQLQNFNDVYFQFLSQTVMALIRIGDAHEHLRREISKAFDTAFATKEYYAHITNRPEKSSEGNMVLAIRNAAFLSAQRWKTTGTE